jgi:sugar/nucleoside kinase (ribokinase family)
LIKIALIGGGSVRTPALAYALAGHWAHLPVIDLGTDFFSEYIRVMLEREGLDRNLIQNREFPTAAVTVALPWQDERAIVSYIEPEQLPHHPGSSWAWPRALPWRPACATATWPADCRQEKVTGGPWQSAEHLPAPCCEKPIS